jgi:hypothetical protein
MPSLLTLTRGTQKVIQTSFNNAKAPGMKISQINIVSLRGVNVKQITALVDSVSEPGKMYKCWMMFTGVKEAHKTKPSMNTEVFVRCSCDSFYYWFGYFNKKFGALAGRGMKPYTRKTDNPNLVRNKQELPGLCKHLIFMTAELVRKKKII